jgi:hypothetical protein
LSRVQAKLLCRREQGSFPALKIQNVRYDGNLIFTLVLTKTKEKIQITCNLDNIGELLIELLGNCKLAWKSGKLIIADGISNP